MIGCLELLAAVVLTFHDKPRPQPYTSRATLQELRMNSIFRLLSLVVLLVGSALSSYTQTGDAKTQDTTKPASTPTKAKDPDADRIAKQRRSQARSLLVALSVDARTFRDQTLRARSL